LRRVDAGIGDSVRVVGSGGEKQRFRVVGRVALPVFAAEGDEGGDVQAIADGASFTGDGLSRIGGFGSSAQTRLLIRWRDGVDVDAARDRISELPGGTHRPLAAKVPLEVDRLQQLRLLPWVLGAFLAAIGALGVGYGIVTSVRRRARELAILKTIGFRRAQVEVSVATQATLCGLVGLVIGIPVGVLVGRAAWSRIAGRSGFAVVPVVPIAVLAAVVLGTLVIVNVVAWWPARRAARLRPAVVLRSE
jgi:predicted lysophospholipase L1 biosynthesis ABC-type transport system permease subunit